MPRKNFYVPDAEIPIYEKAKEYVGDSISSFIMDSLKNLVYEMEDKGKDLSEVRLWVGYESLSQGIKHGEYIKFTGRLLGQCTYDFDNVRTADYQIYETRKGMFLLHKTLLDKNSGDVDSSYVKYKDYQEVTKQQLPSELLSQVESALKDFKCVELDI